LAAPEAADCCGNATIKFTVGTGKPLIFRLTN
jgi:hypothetical protein